MTNRLFELPCPQCRVGLTMIDEGTGRCPICHQTYLIRMGHLVLIEATLLEEPQSESLR